MLRGMVVPVLTVLEFGETDPAIQDLILKAMQSNFHRTNPCQVCGGPHDADGCRACGFAFLSPWLQKIVKQYNAVHRDQPKNPPPDNPPAPHQASFAHQPEKRNTEVVWDAPDASVMSSDTDGIDFDVESDQPLELHAVMTKSDMDASTIDKIAHDLSILANRLDVNPRYAVMDLRGLKSDDLPQKPTDTERDITTPLTLGNYDTYDYNKQVKA